MGPKRISVTDPVKQGDGVTAYTSYRVTTMDESANSLSESSPVIRRFSDFEWLHDRLAETHKGTIIPPLPEKNAIAKFRFDPSFIECRRRGLETFINRVAAHPRLTHSPQLSLFLHASEDNWAVEIAKPSTSLDSASQPLAKTASGFMRLFQDVRASLSHVVLGGELPFDPTVDPENERLRSYAEALEGHVEDCHVQAGRVVKKLKEFSAAQSALGSSLIRLSESQTTESRAAADGRGGDLGRLLADSGRRLESVAGRASQQADSLWMEFEEPMKEIHRLVGSLRSTVTARTDALKQQQQTQSQLSAKRTRLERMRAMQPQPKADKLQEAEREIEQLSEQLQAQETLFNSIVAAMASEVTLFHETKLASMACVLAKFAMLQRDFNLEIASAWKSLLPSLSRDSATAAAILGQ